VRVREPVAGGFVHAEQMRHRNVWCHDRYSQGCCSRQVPLERRTPTSP
jgi:hypothetical protein